MHGMPYFLLAVYLGLPYTQIVEIRSPTMKTYTVTAEISGVRTRVNVLAKNWAQAIRFAGSALGATVPFYAFCRSRGG